MNTGQKSSPALESSEKTHGRKTLINFLQRGNTNQNMEEVGNE